jgi:hypothetical protein
MARKQKNEVRKVGINIKTQQRATQTSMMEMIQMQNNRRKTEKN